MASPWSLLSRSRIPLPSQRQPYRTQGRRTVHNPPSRDGVIGTTRYRLWPLDGSRQPLRTGRGCRRRCQPSSVWRRCRCRWARRSADHQSLWPKSISGVRLARVETVGWEWSLERLAAVKTASASVLGSDDLVTMDAADHQMLTEQPHASPSCPAPRSPIVHSCGSPVSASDSHALQRTPSSSMLLLNTGRPVPPAVGHAVTPFGV